MRGCRQRRSSGPLEGDRGVAPRSSHGVGQSTVAEVGHSVLLLLRVCGMTAVCVMDELAVGGESEIAGRTVLLSSARSMWMRRVLKAGQGRDVGSQSQMFSFARTTFASQEASLAGERDIMQQLD